MGLIGKTAVSLFSACAMLVSFCAVAANYVPGEVLVKYKADSRPAAVDAVAESITPQTAIPGLNTLHLKADVSVAQAVAMLARDPGVEFAQPNYIKRWQKTPDDPKFGLQWALANTAQTVPLSSGSTSAGFADADIDADSAWDLSTGASTVVVAVLDSGVDYTHPDLSPNIWQNPGETAVDGVDNDGNGYIDDTMGWDFVNNDRIPADISGHGTHVAGIIAAKGNDGSTVAGVGWSTKIMPLQVVDANGNTTTSANIVKAITYAVDNGAKIINASYGQTLNDSAEKAAISYANDHGVLVVAAACNNSADNDTPSTSCYPASYDLSNIIAVGASDMFDNRASFSNYGATSVDLFAPGESIVSTYPEFTAVWSQDFSTNTTFTAWTTGGISNTWAVSSNALQDSPSGNYVASTDSWAGPQLPVNIAGKSGCRITTSFSSIYLQNIDKLLIEVSTDGINWSSVGEVSISNQSSSLDVYADITAFTSTSLYYRYHLQANSDSNVSDGVSISKSTVECYSGAYDQNAYAYLDGTSVAAPFVSGTAALLMAYDNTLTATQVRDRIINGVDTKTSLSNLAVSGGRLNTARALNPSFTDTTTSTPSNVSGGSGGGGSISLWWLVFLVALSKRGISSTVKRAGRVGPLFLFVVALFYVVEAGAAAPTGYREVMLQGTQTSSEFGYSTAAGDFNNDGYSDLAVGISGYNSSTGRVSVYYGSVFGLPASPDWTVDGATSIGYLGAALAAGDVDGDNIDDLIIGEPGKDNTYTGTGSVYIFRGSASGLVASQALGDADLTLKSPNYMSQTDDRFGMSMAVLGDVNGDTYPDLMVGAYLYDNGQTDEGAVFIYHGNGLGGIFSDTTTPTILEIDQAGAEFGRSVALAGKLNNDAYPDIIIGADYYTNPETGEGAAFVYNGTGSGTGITATPVWQMESGVAYASLGASVASAGDINKDGYDDVIIGAWAYGDSGSSLYTLGEAFVFYGSSSGLAGTAGPPTVAAPGDADWRVVGQNSYEALGTSVASVGDINNDNYADIIVGIEGYCGSGSCSGDGDGKAVIYYGSSGGLSLTADWSSTYTADRLYSHYGAWVHPAGDIDGDGKADFAVSAYHYSVSNLEGAVFVYLSSPAPEVLTSPSSGLVTTEAGGTDSFTLELATQPADNVVVAVSSSLTSEGTVSSSSVTFTTSNWNVPQTITVTGQDDHAIDGDIPYNINFTVTSTGDSNYDGNNPASVAVTNTDDDTAGFVVDTGDGVVTKYNATDTFTMTLTSMPTADVVIGLSSSNASEGTVSPSSLTFTSGNWSDSNLHAVTVTGTNPNPANTTYSIVTAKDTTTADTNYKNLDPTDVTVTSRLSSVTIAATANAAEPSTNGYFTVSRDGNTSQALTVNYSLDAASTAASGTDFAALSGSVTISAGKISALVYVFPINDTIAEGNETVKLNISSDAAYTVGTQSSATMTLQDDDIAPTASFGPSQTVTEGSTVTVNVTLSYQAFAYPVTIPYTISGTATNPSDHNAADGTITINSGTTGSFSFKTVNDGVTEGNETVIVTMGTPKKASLGATPTQTVTIVDGSGGGSGSSSGGGGGGGVPGPLLLSLLLLRRLRPPRLAA